jgi:hypothetical protein
LSEGASTVDEGVRIKLREILTSHGEALRRDPQRMEAILRDHCPEKRREVHVLLSAARAGLVEELVGSWGAGPPEILVARLSQRLHEEMGITPPLARWAIESWAYALYNVRFRPRAEPRPAAAAAGPVAGKKAAGGPVGRGIAFLSAIPRRIRDRRDPHRVHLLIGVIAAGILVAACGMALFSRRSRPEPIPAPRRGEREVPTPSPPVPGPAAGPESGAGPQTGAGGPTPGAEADGFTPAQARELLKAQYPGEEFQLARVIPGSFTVSGAREAVFAVTSHLYSPMECRSRLWLASAEGGWHLVGEVMPKVTSVTQVVDVDRDGISEVLTSYSCAFRGTLEETREVISLKNFPRSNLRRLFQMTETGPQPEGAAPPTIPYHEINFRDYSGEAGLVLCDEVTDPVLKSRRCKNYHLKDEVYALAEDIVDCAGSAGEPAR